MTSVVAPDRAPDLITAVIGYRQWRLTGGELRSVFADDVWPAPMLDARCKHEPEHGAPVTECTCGVYAWYRPSPRSALTGPSALVTGAVVMWGQVELHADGMRAQHCRIVALAVPSLSARKRERVRTVAARLGVQAVPHRELRRAATAHGAPVPREFIPPRHVGMVGPPPAGSRRPLVMFETGTASPQSAASTPRKP